MKNTDNKGPIRVVVVDDSAFLRRTLPKLLESDPAIHVVGTAENGAAAIKMVKALRPDVITMDVIMPVMDGLTALKQIMEKYPTPVVMLSMTTYEGTKQAIEALSSGAVDFIPKPSGAVSLDIAKIRENLVEKVKLAYESKSKLSASPGSLATKPKPETDGPPKGISPRLSDQHIRGKSREILAIAASTGGPAALEAVLSKLPADLPMGIVIVQHITEGFSEALAGKLNRISPLTIKVAEDGEPITPGTGLVIPTGRQMIVKRINGKLSGIFSNDFEDVLYKPSANILFSSVAAVCGPAAVGVIMTGMSNDGAKGIKEIREAYGTTIAQDESTSLIFGMPKAAIDIGGIDIVAPLHRISHEILKALRPGRANGPERKV